MDIGMLQPEQGPTNAKNRTHTRTGMGKEEMHMGEDIQSIRRQAGLAKISQEDPETETWPNQEYDEQDIGRELRNLANRKAHGIDGIP